MIFLYIYHSRIDDKWLFVNEDCWIDIGVFRRRGSTKIIINPIKVIKKEVKKRDPEKLKDSLDAKEAT